MNRAKSCWTEDQKKSGGLSAKAQNKHVDGRSLSGLGCLYQTLGSGFSQWLWVSVSCLTDQPVQSINGNKDVLTNRGGLPDH